MALNDLSNSVFQKAVAFVNQTDRHLFLTGNAGTGKTTFLKYIKENCFKKMAVVAPTGVAAINAGGVTIHSFFQLPFGSFIPVQANNWQNFDGRINNEQTLLKNMRMASARRDILRELDILIIDEVSMVRADVLDMIDVVLRHVRRKPYVPFGGVQMVYIGDLFQLPPVVKNEEWELLREYYKSPFFFDAKAIQQAMPVYVELKKIYRQTDTHFIDILNGVRNNSCTDSDMEELHRFYKPGYEPKPEENFITLTSHNAKADSINERQLNLLPGKKHQYEAGISGDFYENMFPVERVIGLKEGAQVMFIKNDKGEFRRYYNGKIAVVKKIEDDSITVSFPDGGDDLELEKEEWLNLRYNYDKEKDKIEEEELGRFTQYPIRLAWAITIHKSQGLTFEKAIIDAGASFAPGQVYVALSRLTSLDGLVLYSRISPSSISTDNRVREFVKTEMSEEELQQILEAGQAIYIRQKLKQGFEWDRLADAVNLHFENYESRKIPEKNECIEWAWKLNDAVQGQLDVAGNFIKTLEVLFSSCEMDGYTKLLERTTAASSYFLKEVDDKLLQPVKEHIAKMKVKSKTKKYIKELLLLQVDIERKKKGLQEALQIADSLHKSVTMTELLKMVEAQQKPKIIELTDISGKKEKKGKSVKGESSHLSLQMYEEGKTMEEIAAERGLALSTIEGHLIQFISTGEVDVHAFVSDGKLQTILDIMESEPDNTASFYKEKLGNLFSYVEIRAAMKWIELKDEKESE
jgi:hypothetical protein